MEVIECNTLPMHSSVDILSSLSRKGYTVLNLPDKVADLTERVFELFHRFDARHTQEKAGFELTPDALGENNGWHATGGLSRYNQCREGYIYQASCPIWPMLSASRSEVDSDEFSIIHEEWRREVHNFALLLLERLGQSLDIPEASAYFTPPHGQLDIISGSQFHIKKVSGINVLNSSIPRGSAGEFVTMPAHCDPSVISIVIHSQMHSGFQVRDADLKAFVNIPSTGPRKCVVISGTLLELLTDATVKPCVHRVVSTEADLMSSQRLAASFFFQPTIDALLIPFHCTTNVINTDTDTSETDTKRGRRDAYPPPPLTYGKWKSRVYGNYYKGRKAGGQSDSTIAT